MVDGSHVLLLVVEMPLSQSGSSDLKAAVLLQVLVEDLKHQLFAPELDRPKLQLQIVQVEKADTRLEGNLHVVSHRHAFTGHFEIVRLVTCLSQSKYHCLGSDRASR